MELNKIYQGDALEVLKTFPDNSIDCCVTSPPYFGLRDYGISDQIGLEETPASYVFKLTEIFSEVKRVLKKEGTFWLNIGDSYAGYWGDKYAHKPFGEDRTPDMSTPPMKKSPDFEVWGVKNKDLLGIPWRVALSLQSSGWYLRQDIIWAKGVSGQKETADSIVNAMYQSGCSEEQISNVLQYLDLYVGNGMPESVKDRCTKSHEYIFLLTKHHKYYYDIDAVRCPIKQDSIDRKNRGHRAKGHKYESGPGNQTLFRNMDKMINDKGKNLRSVWVVPTKPFKGAHFATYPPDLITPCVLAGCPEGGTVLDPFFGSGTTGVVALKNNRNYIGIELNPEYCKIAEGRLNGTK
jgi:DNA modification methylase